METRLVIERHAIEKVVRSGAAIFDALEVELRKQDELVWVGDTPAFVESDREFHRVLDPPPPVSDPVPSFNGRCATDRAACSRTGASCSPYHPDRRDRRARWLPR